MKPTVVVSVAMALLFAVRPSLGWELSANFDSQSAGARCELLTSSASVVSTDTSASGNKSCKTSIEAGDTGFGVFGGIIKLPAMLNRGEEIWVRFRMYLPPGFDYRAPGEGGRLKFIRVHTRSAGDENLGYDDWYIQGPDAANPYGFIYEGEQKWTFVGSSANKLRLGTWETFELYLRLDSTPRDSGGLAQVRMWKDGKLMADIGNRKTLANDAAFVDRVHLFTYWNGASPATQSLFLDDIVVTDTTPSNRDEFGNAFVGLEQAVGPKPPSPVDVR